MLTQLKLQLLQVALRFLQLVARYSMDMLLSLLSPLLFKSLPAGHLFDYALYQLTNSVEVNI